MTVVTSQGGIQSSHSCSRFRN